MVRTPSPVVPLPIEASRVLGWSTAIAVHALAMMLLLIPAAQPLITAPRERMRVSWVLPPPPQPEIIRHPPADPQRLPPTVPVTTQRAPAPLPTPTATLDEAPAVAPMPASETAAPALEPAPAAPSPAAGAQLQYRSAPPPPYPVAAIRLGQEGTVLLRIRVGTDGNPVAVSIEKSSGSRALDQAARQQVMRHWRFVPATVNGQVVQADGLVPVEFSLPH